MPADGIPMRARARSALLLSQVSRLSPSFTLPSRSPRAHGHMGTRDGAALGKSDFPLWESGRGWIGGGGGRTYGEWRTARGGTGHLGRTETQRGRLWTACGQRCVGSKNSQTTPATTSTSSIGQLLGAADAQTAHHTTSSTAPAHQPRGSANAERHQQEHRPQRPTESSDPTQHAKGRTGDCPGPRKEATQPDGLSHRGSLAGWA